MISTSYAFITAYLKGQESKHITPDHIDKMLKTSNVPEALDSIRDTDLGDYLREASVSTFDEIDESLWTYFRYCLQRIKWFQLKRFKFLFVPIEIVKIMAAYPIKYDVSNIKAALRTVLTGKKASLIPVGVIYDYGLLDELSSAESLGDIIEILTECQLENYGTILRENGKLPDEGLESRLRVEARLVSEYYRNMLDMTGQMKDRALLSQAFRLIIDLTNLKIILRAIIDGMGSEAAEYIISDGYMIDGEVANQLLSLNLDDIPASLKNTPYQEMASEVVSGYKRTKDITIIEKIIEKQKLTAVKEILWLKVLSPVMIAWYLIVKEIEMRNVRLILRGVIDRVPLDEIREFLVLPS